MENQRPQGKEAVFNKVKFSSIKLGETKQGSATVNLYLKPEECAKMAELLNELSQSPTGGKIGVIVIQGEKYDSGYAYVNPKEEQQQANGGGGFKGGNGGKSYGQQAKQTQFGNKQNARSFLNSKRLNDGGQEK